MPRDQLSSPNFKSPMLLDGSPGASGQSPVSRGSGLPPAYEYRVEFVKSSTVPTDPVDGTIWFNPDTGIKAEYIVTASGGKWVELVAPGVAVSGDALPPLMTSSEYIDGSETALRSINPVILTDALSYYFVLGIEGAYDAIFDRVATGNRSNIGSQEIVTGGIATATKEQLTGSGSLTISPANETDVVFSTPITGNFTFLFNTSQIEDIRLTDYSWRGTIRFNYLGGTLTFFTGTTSYSVEWEEGAQPVFEAGRDYVVGVAVDGPTSEIRLSVISGIPKVTGSVKITVGTTPPASPALNDLWVDTN